jgi:hypothetical protein
MAEYSPVTDDEILSGFASLQQAIAIGFERQKADLRSMVHEVVGEEIAHLEHRMLRRFDEVDARFNRIDLRFDGVDARLDRMDVRFDGIDSRLDRMDRRFDGIDARLDRASL